MGQSNDPKVRYEQATSKGYSGNSQNESKPDERPPIDEREKPTSKNQPSNS